jgi:hypothetical protein
VERAWTRGSAGSASPTTTSSGGAGARGAVSGAGHPGRGGEDGRGRGHHRALPEEWIPKGRRHGRRASGSGSRAAWCTCPTRSREGREAAAGSCRRSRTWWTSVEGFNARLHDPASTTGRSNGPGREGLPTGAGSDAHTLGEIGNAWVESPRSTTIPASFLAALGSLHGTGGFAARPHRLHRRQAVAVTGVAPSPCPAPVAPPRVAGVTTETRGPAPIDQILAVPAPAREPFLELLARIDEARDIALTTHVNADGDGAGSEAALAGWLLERGKRVSHREPDAVPRPVPLPAPRWRRGAWSRDPSLDSRARAGRAAPGAGHRRAPPHRARRPVPPGGRGRRHRPPPAVGRRPSRGPASGTRRRAPPAS